MRENLNKILRKVIYHPVNSRIAYDTVFSLLVSAFSYVLFSLQEINLLYIALFPILFLGCNFLTGVYGSLKMSSTKTKVIALSFSSFFTFLFLSFLGGNPTPLFNAAVFIAAFTSLPRVFLNFSNSNIKNPTVSNILLANAPVLVVGGGGYIGSVLVEKMLKENMRVRVFDKFIYGQEVFSDIKNDKRLEILEGDATDLYSLTSAMKNVQSVVHLAGIVGDPASMVDDRLTRHMNIVSTRMIKETAKAFRIPKFIFASSCSVYGASDKIVNENSPLNPLSPYAKSKIDSEKELLQDYFDEFHPTILRFATVFGHSRKPRFDLVLNLFVAQALKNGFITVTGESQWRPFVHTKDLATAIIKVLNSPKEKTSRQIYNIGDDSLHITIGELAKSVQNVLASEKKVRIITRNNDADLRNYRVSFKKAREELDFKAEVSVEDGIKEILDHFKLGTYKKPYTDVYYSAFETTKEIKKEFYSESYQKSHFSDLVFDPKE